MAAVAEAQAHTHTQAEWEALIEASEQSLETQGDHSQEDGKGGNGPIGLEELGLAGTIDHTLLKLDATQEQIDGLCEEARGHGFKSVCVRLPWVTRCVERLKGSSVVVACVIGFHEGTYTTEEKTSEAVAAIKAGASELDMVINHVLLRQHQYPEVFADIAAVAAVCSAPTSSSDIASTPILLKVILETALLQKRDIVAGCNLACAAGADFAKTCTGFVDGPGARIEDVRLMQRACDLYVRNTMSKDNGNGSPKRVKVKASGGIRSAEDAVKIIEAGAERIGTSSGVKIMLEAQERSNGGVRTAEVEAASTSY